MRLPVTAFLVLAWPSGAFAQLGPVEAKAAAEMMVASASACAAYLSRPELVGELRGRARQGLIDAGMTNAESDSFLDGLIEAEKTRTYDKGQQQVGCEMINIRAIEVQ